MDNHSKGVIGENHACVFLEKEGFRVIERNYRKKWGEIDIIATKDEHLHFFEVKSLKVVSINMLDEAYRPEENVHSLKVRNIRRTIETYLFEKVPDDTHDFSFHVLCVYYESVTGKSKVRWLKDVIL